MNLLSFLKRKTGKAVLFGILLSVFFLPAVSASADSLLPEGVSIQSTFKPGSGKPVGKIDIVQGRVVIIHKKDTVGYEAKDQFPVFKGDTIITLKKGRVRIGFFDGSILTLSSRTRIVINASFYSSREKVRTSFFSMALGKVRFYIKKLLNFRKSDVSVRTKTAILGVRGSDFVVVATDISTEVTALKNTILEVRSLAKVEMRPSMIEDFERVNIALEALPSAIEKVNQREITDLLEDMIEIPGTSVRMDSPEVRKSPEKKDKGTQGGEMTSETTVSGSEEQEGIEPDTDNKLQPGGKQVGAEPNEPLKEGEPGFDESGYVDMEGIEEANIEEPLGPEEFPFSDQGLEPETQTVEQPNVTADVAQEIAGDVTQDVAEQIQEDVDYLPTLPEPPDKFDPNR